MGRLHRVSVEAPGITRHRRGRGFGYRDAGGRRIDDPGTLARIRGLAIPPAWTDVWICADPLGHLQAVGTDEAGRRQYRYHDRWRRRRDEEKFDRMLAFAAELPDARARVAADLASEGMPRERVLACAFRLLDHGAFRVGSESYARENGSFGLATLRRDHVRVRDGVVRFDFLAKSGVRRMQEVADPDVARVVGALKRRRGGGPELLAYRDGRTWRDVRSTEVNAYVKEAVGEGFSAKDFRTWQGTVAAAVALASADGDRTSVTSRRREVSAAMKEVGALLGNTPSVARSSYVDPRLIDRHEEGRTIRADLERLETRDADGETWREAVERAVLGLLVEDTADVERAA